MTAPPIDPHPSDVRSWRCLYAASLIVRLLLGAQVVLALLHFARVPDQVVALDRIQGPASLGRTERIRVVLTDANVSRLVWWAFVVATAAAFAVWLCIALAQLGRVDEEHHASSVGTCVVWFVPIVNLIMPKGYLDEVVAAQYRHHGRGSTMASTPLLVTVWWVSWVITGVGTCFMLGMASSATTPVDAQNAAVELAVCDAAVIVSAVLGWIAVARVTGGQRAIALREPIEDRPRELRGQRV